MAGLRTSREVYMRVRWDTHYDETQFVIGCDDRAQGMKEIAFTEFVPDGDIPWHRVWYFRAGETVYWDRARKLDRIFGSGETEDTTRPPPPIAAEPTQEEPRGGPRFEPVPALRFREAGWQPVELGESTGGLRDGVLRLATYNVLFDLFDADRIYTAARIPALLDTLRSVDADVIALEEVTPKLVQALRDAPWVRRDYAISGDERVVSPHGQFILSRLPVHSFAKHYFGRDKSLLVSEIDVAGEPLALAAVHLSSSRADQARQKRASELSVAREFLSFARDVNGALDAVVCGDFNLDDEAEVRPLSADGFVDAWPALRPGEPGFTFDPRENALARIMSSSQRQQRIDRVFMRSPGARLALRGIELFGTEPFGDGRWVSDHWGVCVECAIDQRHLVSEDPAHHSALIVMPPESQWEEIQAIRRQWDPHVERWMPHVNLLYGFVPDHRFGEAVQALERALSAFEPFDATLKTFRHFDHRRSATVWLDPRTEPVDRLQQLQAVVHSVFPQCREQNLKSGAGFRAHLSVAQLRGDDASDRSRRMREWAHGWEPVRFTVRDVALISRREAEPFVVRARARLGVQPARAAARPWSEFLEDAGRTQARHALIEQLRQAVEASVDGAALELVGSSNLGVTLPHSDIDAVVFAPDPPGWETLLMALERDLPIERATRVRDARVPVLRLRIRGFDVDLQIHACATPLPGDFESACALGLDETALRALGAVWHARYLHEALSAGDLFDVLGAIRVWARCREIDRKALGFVGGMGWATLVAHAGAGGARTSTDVVQFLAGAFSVDRSRAVTRPQILGDAPVELAQPSDYLVIATPCAPWGNLTPSVSRSTLAVLREEIRRARDEPARMWEEIEIAGWERYVVVDLDPRAEEEESVDAARGWLEGHLIGLVVGLERAGFAVRPFATRDGFVLGVQGTGDHVDAFTRFRSRFREAHPGLQLRVRMRQTSAPGDPTPGAL